MHTLPYIKIRDFSQISFCFEPFNGANGVVKFEWLHHWIYLYTGPQNWNAFHVFIIAFNSLPKLREVNLRLHGRNNTKISLGGADIFKEISDSVKLKLLNFDKFQI